MRATLLPLALLLPAVGAASDGALGVEVDLLPPVMSAVAGGPGFSGQVWMGAGRWRARAVGARILFPDALGPPDPFDDQRLAVAAVIVDRFFDHSFQGPWVGAGVEYWWSSVGHATSSERAAWQSPVLTAGAGWVWRFWRDLHLNPWGAVHWSTRGETVQVGADAWTPRRFSAEVSLKVGWTFGI